MDENTNTETNLYEIGFHFLPLIKEEEILIETQKLKDLLQDKGAHLIGDESIPKLTTLAYKISKKIENKKTNFDKAYFGWIKFEASTDQVESIKREVDNLENVLRFMIVKTVRSETMPTKRVVLEKRTETEDKKEKVQKEKVSDKGVDEAIDELVIE